MVSYGLLLVLIFLSFLSHSLCDYYQLAQTILRHCNVTSLVRPPIDIINLVIAIQTLSTHNSQLGLSEHNYECTFAYEHCPSSN